MFTLLSERLSVGSEDASSESKLKNSSGVNSRADNDFFKTVNGQIHVLIFQLIDVF